MSCATCLYSVSVREEKEFLIKLINAHWKYIEGVLANAYLNSGIEHTPIKEIEYHYKTAFEHGWRHAKEHYTGSV